MKTGFPLMLLALVAVVSPLHLPAQAPRLPENVKAHRDLVYVENGHERHKLDLYLPEKAEGPLPVIIWVHGGGWQGGSKDGCPPLRAGYLARGYAVASINYRLSGHAAFPAQIEDCKAAIRWLRHHAREYGLDPARFGAWGSSAGGHLVALLGTSGEVKEFDVGQFLDQSSRVQAVCDYYGPTDLVAFVSTAGYERHADANSPESKLIGGLVKENREKAEKANPIRYVSSDDPPFLIVHGDKDAVVPLNQSELLFEALKKAGVSVHFHTIKGAGHGGPGFAGADLSEKVSAFFDSRLKAGGELAAEATTSESTVSPEAASRDPRMNRDGRRPMPWQAVSRRFDKNDDGRVTKEEYDGPAQLFQRADRNRDGVLTREEYEALAPPSAGN
jgi:acetyl esterase/lipase